jgi:hypothetical protein
MRAQQEMHAEQHITPVEEERPSDLELVQQEATMADVRARCREDAEGKRTTKGQQEW